MTSEHENYQSDQLINRRNVLKTSAVGLVSSVAVTSFASPVAAQNSTNQTETSTGASNDTETDDSESTTQEDDGDAGTESTVCGGAPKMSRTSVTSPNSRITQEDPAVVEANFRPDPTIPGDCTIMVDLEFSFTDAGYQWGGGTQWDQATTDLVVGTFEVRPGEIRDIRAELHTQGAEAGDQVTVVADYELWFKGNREESVQQSGIRHTIEVEEPNPPEDEQSVIRDASPGFGIGTMLTALGTGGYLLKSKLSGETE